MNIVRTGMLRFSRKLFGILLALLLMPSAAWAAASCHANYSGFTLTLPGSVAVARDLPDGSVLTPWAIMPMTNNLFTCTVTEKWFTGAAFDYAGMTSGGASSKTTFTANYGGTALPVYQTNVPGVGIAMGVNGIAGGVAQPLAGFHFVAYNNPNGTVQNGGQLLVALVKIGAITPGTVAGGTVAHGVALEATSPTWTGLNPADGIIDYSITPVVITVLTCQTPDVNVPMGTHGPADLPSVGSTSANPATVNLRFNNCPGGTAIPGTSAGLINSVQYKIDPSNGLISGFQNVAALSGTSSASGVGIQLFDSTGAVFPYGTYQPLTGFSGATTGSYTVSLTARYYRTGNLGAGSADTQMIMTVMYQ
jgi:major type 1 subunit fimbrin (pilin)